ncbi:MAG: selenocysteine-specific translation elongation factor [Candidatus Omnitrophica bacterium]|nr:selenocysteine-specific translation elongation factor [Candidatus Omnitrophota bacterium]
MKLKDAQIIPVMVGTAGHVDHGKTELVKLLTGCDTDCLIEEKKRGLSIDLGFAPLMMSKERMVGIIDVPGHEDFIRNMVAGASSIDVLMLVIAADDGIMPQTIEHLKVVTLLRAPRVMAVITKTDLVTQAKAEEVKRDVKKFLAQYGYNDAPIILESNRTFEGLEEVRSTITKLVESVERNDREKAFRMHVERVFSVKGYGTVVTGIPISGQCKIGDKLELFPGPQNTIVRAVQKYKRDSEYTEAHVCSAINVRNIKAEEVERGMTIAEPGIFKETTSAILAVTNVHETIIIKKRSKMKLHCGTNVSVVEGLLIGIESLKPNDKGFMRIKYNEPKILASGDRYILRSLSPSTTVAGGIVLSTRTFAGRKKRSKGIERLETAKNAAYREDIFFAELMAGDPVIVNRADLVSAFQCRQDEVTILIEKKEQQDIIRKIGSTQWVVTMRKTEIEEQLFPHLSRYHKKNQLTREMPAEVVCTILGLPRDSFKSLEKVFSDSKAVKVTSTGISLSGFQPELSSKLKDLKEKISNSVMNAGLNAVAKGNIESQFDITPQDMKVLLKILTEEGTIIVMEHYLIQAQTVNTCLEKFVKIFEKNKIAELSEFRKETGLTRNVAVAVLEHFDLKGISKREGNGRRLVARG